MAGPRRNVRTRQCTREADLARIKGLITRRPPRDRFRYGSLVAMRIYWSLAQVPEMRGLARAERLRVHRATYWHSFQSVRCWAALVVCGLCAGGGALLGLRINSLLAVSPSSWYFIASAGVGGGIGGLIYGSVVTDYLRPFYADYIKLKLQEGEV